MITVSGKEAGSKEEWDIVISKKTSKLIKQLEGYNAIHWQSPTQPILKKWAQQIPIVNKGAVNQQQTSTMQKNMITKSEKNRINHRNPKQLVSRNEEGETKMHRTAIRLANYMGNLIAVKETKSPISGNDINKADPCHMTRRKRNKFKNHAMITLRIEAKQNMSAIVPERWGSTLRNQTGK
ncbi:hypothetical protein AXF42_Ash003615 [Apostasia shenzhenica]|uniref:Uncharacterized protein n=1 Tax=Apostasia shenzhenica TaxID=1088818 RepID=A0A2I0AHD7_9ASPA|nr:hypothetical protein AXF42_Ash003615 [Apostasia shenzhenica]